MIYIPCRVNPSDSTMMRLSTVPEFSQQTLHLCVPGAIFIVPRTTGTFLISSTLGSDQLDFEIYFCPR